METVKLYYEDAYIKEFDAKVVSCRKSDKNNKTWLIELDRTAFYPEGGGQPADVGEIIASGSNESLSAAAKVENACGNESCDVNVLSNNCSDSSKNILKKVSVTDVQEKDGQILHYCDAEIEPGTIVHGIIDWERRFDHMQQHSGEHIVSGMICEAFNCDNVGFHMGADIITIDYNADITEEELLKIEEKANKYIWEDHRIEISFPGEKELAALEYRSKKELSGAVRIVSFPGADTCACCGTHVERSAEVGLVKFLSCQKFTKGSRIELLCGKRAFDYLSICREQNRIIARAMAASYDKTANVYMKQRTELSELKYKLSLTEQKLFEKIAEQYEDEGDVLFFTEGLDPDSVRKLCVLIAEHCKGRSVVFSADSAECVDDSNQHAENVNTKAIAETTCAADIDIQKKDAVKSCRRYKYAVKLKEEDDPKLIRDMNTVLNGRGGGKGGFAQGSASASEQDIRAFFERLG